jgi:hypothetical protein
MKKVPIRVAPFSIKVLDETKNDFIQKKLEYLHYIILSLEVNFRVDYCPYYLIGFVMLRTEA